MAPQKLPEVWLRGPVDHVTALLQPVAHALLQAREELNETLRNFPAELLWETPAEAASVGFHLQHLRGVLDRLFTYARGQSLNEEQLAALKAEGIPCSATPFDLEEAFNRQVDSALKYLQLVKEDQITEYRAVGRAKLPSTVAGLLFHAAEHTMRHLGQLIVTVKVVKKIADQD